MMFASVVCIACYDVNRHKACQVVLMRKSRLSAFLEISPYGVLLITPFTCIESEVSDQ